MHPDFALSWYGRSLAEAGYRPATIRTKLAQGRTWNAYLAAKKIDDVRAVDRSCLEGYASFLRERISPRSSKPYRPSTQACLWGTAVGIVKALYEEGILPSLPVPLSLVRSPREALVTLLTESDIGKLLESIDEEAPHGRRDRALFELVYATGIRAGEVGKLTWEDLKLDERSAFIKQGKYDKDRVVPLTHEAVEMLRRYRAQKTRPSTYVFPGYTAGLSTSWVNRLFKRLAVAAGLYRHGVTTHQLRHACATHLIAHGADIRYVQELLGHNSIETTVRYTRNQVPEVKRIHERFHPREYALYAAVDETYLLRLDALVQAIKNGRKKYLARLKKAGYTGGIETFLDG